MSVSKVQGELYTSKSWLHLSKSILWEVENDTKLYFFFSLLVFLNCRCISFHVGGVIRLVKLGRVLVVVGGARRARVCNDFLYLEISFASS